MQLGEIVVRILRSLRCVLFSEDYIVAVSGLNVDLTAGAEVGPDRLVLPTGRLACVQQFPMAFLSCEDINMLCILTGPNQISRLAGKPALVYKVQNGLLRIACLPVFSVQIILVAIVLMGAFGTPDSFFAKIFSPVMRWFGSSITGAIYSFGYTLLIGVIFNLIMGVLASKLMLKSVSQFKFLRKPWLYGGKNDVQ
jgi:hypothetical protein